MAFTQITDSLIDGAVYIALDTSDDIYRYDIYDNFSQATLIASGVTQFYDYFVENGAVYKYEIINDPATEYFMPNHNGSWLYGIYTDLQSNSYAIQTSIIYNENITSYIPVVKDSIVETIGSTYPYVIRQAVVNYNKFNFSGNINFDMNNGQLPLTSVNLGYGISYANFFGFTSSSNISNSQDVYDNFITNNSINYGQNYVAERLFRNDLIRFLNNGKPKLLKTSAEGLFLVRLTNLSLNPERSTGRMIYSFSCDFTEIAKPTLSNINTYIS